MGAQPCSSKTGCRDTLPGHHFSPEILSPSPAPKLCRKPGIPSGPEPGRDPLLQEAGGRPHTQPPSSEHPHLVVRAGPRLLCHPWVQKAPGALERQRPQRPLPNVYRGHKDTPCPHAA